MSFTIRAALTALAIAAPVALAQAQTTQDQTTQDQDHAAHHPAGQTAPRPPAMSRGRMAQPGAMPSGEAGAMPMMDGNMGQMMRGMVAMHAMGAMGGPGRVQPFAHIEGQLAFYRTELKITGAQAPQWNGFADAVRASAKKLQGALAAAMPGGGPLPAVDQMDSRINVLSAALDASKTFADAVKPLYATFSDDQKKIADELMAEHLRGM
jgi:LTXXQ motif family protein